MPGLISLYKASVELAIMDIIYYVDRIPHWALYRISNGLPSKAFTDDI
jgi:hypothetical protein